MAISTLIATLGPLLPDIIKGVEHLFGRGTGAAKKATVENVFLAVLDQLRAAKKFTGDVNQDDLSAAIEAIVAVLHAMKVIPKGGETSTPTQTAVVSNDPVFTFTGQIVGRAK